MWVVSQASLNPDEAKVLKLASDQLAFLTKNMATSTEEEEFKVWPTNEDRAPFRAVMESSARIGVTGQESRMAEAYGYFRETFIKWLTGAGAAARAQSAQGHQSRGGGAAAARPAPAARSAPAARPAPSGGGGQGRSGGGKGGQRG